MRLGLCCTPEEADAALAAGYDYVELPANATRSSETTNLFFSSDVRLFVDGLVRGRATIERAATRRVRIMVLGSGAVRNAAHPGPEAEARFIELAAELDRYAQTLGLRLAPESLNPTETNVGNSLPEMAKALRAAGAPYTADSYHAFVEAGSHEGGEAFWREQMPFAPIHVHFAPWDRAVPTGDEPCLTSFFARLRELGYDERASLECKRDGIPDPAPLRELFDGR